MVVALILIDICLLLAHLCEGIDWMGYPLVLITSICTIVAFTAYDDLKIRIEKLEKKGGGD